MSKQINQATQNQQFCSLNIDVRSLADQIDRLSAMKNWLNLQCQYLDQHIQRSTSQMNTILALQQVQSNNGVGVNSRNTQATMGSGPFNQPVGFSPISGLTSGFNASFNPVFNAAATPSAFPHVFGGVPVSADTYGLNQPIVGFAGSPFQASGLSATNPQQAQQWIDNAQHQIEQMINSLQTAVNHVNNVQTAASAAH